MIDAQCGSVVVYNGEIYNYTALRQTLSDEGIGFHSDTDTEVLLKAYRFWGDSAVQKLRGMFAFALWDAPNAQLHLVRDRMGIKPLYWYEHNSAQGKTILFASEVRALLASGLVPHRIDPVGLASYLWHGFVIEPRTLVAGVEALPAGQTLSIDTGTMQRTTRQYWHLPQPSESQPGHQDGKSLLHASVQEHLVSDVPLGVFLSGGIDSSAIAAQATQREGQRVCTFNIGFEEEGYDESEHARAVAKALGTEHRTETLSQQQFAAQLPEALASLDQPTFDGLNTYYVSRAAREAGLTVALSGAGGDELFGGYRTFQALPRAASALRWAQCLPDGWRDRLARMIARGRFGSNGRVPPQVGLAKLPAAVRTTGQLGALYQLAYALFTPEFYDQLLANEATFNPDWPGVPKETASQWADYTQAGPTPHAIANLELSSFVGQRLLRDTDSTAMASSLEVRVPMLDHRLIEHLGQLSCRDRFRPLGRKALLRQWALDDLDPRLFNRKKNGFVMPFDRWCRQALRLQVQTMLCNRELCKRVGLNPTPVAKLWQAFDEGAPGLYWSRIWAIFVLLWWCQAYDMRL
jgi:asparagine synthase (glutamine-hydrolysing)